MLKAYECVTIANLAENAGFPIAWKRGNYKLHERIHTKQRIYKMILEGRTYESIMQELGISERTLYRYIDIIFTQEQDFLSDTVTAEEMRRQILICRDRFLEDRQEVKQWIKDPNFKDKVDAMNLASELAAAVLRLYQEGPAILERTHKFPANYSPHKALEELEKKMMPTLR
jgi:hypothetical protein